MVCFREGSSRCRWGDRQRRTTVCLLRPEVEGDDPLAVARVQCGPGEGRHRPGTGRE